MSGGGGGPTSSTVTQTNVPEWLRPQVETAIGAATKELFTTKPGEGGTTEITGVKPYTPYSQNPEDYVAGFSPLQQQAFGGAANLRLPGQFGAASFGTQGAALGAAGAGDRYMGMATNPFATQAFMSPYMQNVVDVQQQQAQRQADIANQAMNAKFAQQGAFGGVRQGLAGAQANAELMRQKQNIQATGLQNAFQQAQQAQQFGANLGLQGLNTALAGFGQLGNLGTQQLAAQRDIIGTQNQMGALQREREQNIINQAVQNFAQAQENPMLRLNQFNALLRGYAQPGTTTTQYQAAPPLASQLVGAGTAAYGASRMFAEGGPVSMAGGGLPSINRKVLFDPDSVSLPQVQQSMTNDTLSEVIGVPVALQKQKAAQQSAISVPQDTNTSMDQAMQPAGISALRTNLPTQMAKGGIIAFSGQGQSLVPSTEPEAESTPKSPRKTLSDILDEVRSAYGDTERPTPERLAYMEAIKSGAYKPEDIKKQTGLRILQAGLGVMGGRSPNAFANIAEGVAPAVEGYSKDVEKYKTAKLGEMKSLADLADAQRLEKRGDVKTAADLYSKQLDREQRLATASQKDMVVYAQQYLQMKRVAGDTRPDSVLMNEGMKEYLKEYGQNAARIAAMYSGQGVQQGIAAGAQDLTRAGQEQGAGEKAIAAWNSMLKSAASPVSMEYRRLQKKDRETGGNEASTYRENWIKENTPKPTAAPSPVPSPARPSTAKPAPAAPAEKPAKKPDISGITGAPAGSSIGGFIQGKGWEVKDKSGKLLGYAQ